VTVNQSLVKTRIKPGKSNNTKVIAPCALLSILALEVKVKVKYVHSNGTEVPVGL